MFTFMVRVTGAEMIYPSSFQANIPRKNPAIILGQYPGTFFSDIQGAFRDDDIINP